MDSPEPDKNLAPICQMTAFAQGWARHTLLPFVTEKVHVWSRQNA